uniref:NADH dehydrogenase subunit 6 n=1 Tax=Trocnadella arisana TaxID=1437250 RepID=A0A342KAG9_9HEMI|nr:NADH dehydrogenase subunit 6 [Trocnadella arisana]AMY96203.1 NADH dehydrogenase subunit 6 [Trocnadella arisana]
MKILMMKLIILNSTLIPFMKNPLSIMTILISKTIFISIFMNLISESSWFSMMFFLMMLGGLLIMFSYMTSMVFNEKFKFKINLTLIFMILMMTTDEMNLNIMNEMQSIMMNKYIPKYSLLKMFNKNSYIMMLFMIMYLFLTMIMVSKLIMKNMGPLRSKNYE